jgi:glycerol kinase
MATQEAAIDSRSEAVPSTEKFETVVIGGGQAGLAVGYWADVEVLRRNWHRAARWEPTMEPGLRRHEHAEWTRAVQRTYGWARPSASVQADDLGTPPEPHLFRA